MARWKLAVAPFVQHPSSAFPNDLFRGAGVPTYGTLYEVVSATDAKRRRGVAAVLAASGALPVIAQPFGKTRLFNTEPGKVDVHRCHRRNICDQRQVDLFAGELVKSVNEVVTINHFAVVGAAG